jgi:microtubule-associated protein-like 5
MGNNIEILKNHTRYSDNSPLLNKPIAKLKEYFGSYKTICENFCIDLTEFEQIFSVGENSFVIWDVDKNGLIDALELFSGLIVFSDSKLEDKVRFLFDIFDLNEIKCLSKTDVEFMIYSILNSTFKIFAIKQHIDVGEISAFVTEENQLDEEKTFTISEFIKFSVKNQSVKLFFDLISRKNQKLPNQ